VRVSPPRHACILRIHHTHDSCMGCVISAGGLWSFAGGVKLDGDGAESLVVMARGLAATGGAGRGERSPRVPAEVRHVIVVHTRA
jgi:hypothetical protein